MMTTQARTQDKGDLRQWLTDDHERLDALFERLLAAFHAGARAELGPLWTEFDSRLRSHMALEEEHILPEFTKVDPVEAKALAREHVRVRELLSELDIAVDLHLAREATIVELVALLRAHANRENALMYRWASSNLGEAKQRGVIAELRDTLSKLANKGRA